MDDVTAYYYVIGTLYFCLITLTTDIVFQCSMSNVDMVLSASNVDMVLSASNVDMVLPANNVDMVLPANNIEMDKMIMSSYPSLYLINKCYYQFVASGFIISTIFVVELFYNSADLISGDSIRSAIDVVAGSSIDVIAGSSIDVGAGSSIDVIAGSSLAAPPLNVSEDSDSLTSVVNLIVEASNPPSNAFVEASDSESSIDMTAYKRLIAVLHS